MIPFDEAYRIALDSARALDTETVGFAEAAGRVLAQDVCADMAMPPFNKAMVDGYACRRADLGGPLELVDTVAAGYEPKRAVGAGQCVKIMTGAMVPEGADCVFMVEHSEVDGDRVRFARDETTDNITQTGRDFKPGDVLLQRGHRLKPADVAVLASTGCVSPSVYRRPRVSVLATGDELVEPSAKPSPWQIRNSNAYQVCVQASQIGCVATNHGVALDNDASLDECLDRALADCDVLVMSGGVSMGEFDLVPSAMKRHGLAIKYDRVAIQPGKPTTFARSDSQWCFGLPGNPVSSYVIFEILTKPFLFALMGHAYRPPRVRLTLARTMTRKSGARRSWVPVVTVGNGKVDRVEYFGSSHINALSMAEGLVAFQEGETELPEGSMVDVRLIHD